MPISKLLIDLDGTLYPNNNGIWEAIAHKMETYMQQVLKIDALDIQVLRQHYYQTYGTTLRGLQENYQVDPHHYLAYVHDIPIAQYLKPDPELNNILENLPQEKWIFTNSDTVHANRVLSALGISHHFIDILDIVKMNFRNKPDPEVYLRALDAIGNPPAENCLFADDAPKNLIPAQKLGIHTVLVGKNQMESNHHHHISVIHELPAVLEKLQKITG